MKPAIMAMLLVTVATSQLAPRPAVPPQLSRDLLQHEEQEIVKGTVIAYDWSTRYYMEGARVERFVFRTEDRPRTATRAPRFMRVVLLWHPADRPRIMPSDFYAPEKHWQLTLSKTMPFDFVRQYCTTGDSPTFLVEVGKGRKVELPRYVSPAVLSPEVDLVTNFQTAMARRPSSPDMPNPRSLPCMYLEKVVPASNEE